MTRFAIPRGGPPDEPLETVEPESARSRAPARAEARACIACGEPISELVETRPEYCFVCAVHVVCACADEAD